MAPKLIPSILVCVTSQTSCERLIRAGSKLLEDSQQLRVLSIQPRSQANGNPDALEHLFSVSTDVGAEMAVYYSDNPVDTAKMYINRHPIVKIVVGARAGRRRESLHLLPAPGLPGHPHSRRHRGQPVDPDQLRGDHPVNLLPIPALFQPARYFRARFCRIPRPGLTEGPYSTALKQTVKGWRNRVKRCIVLAGIALQ